MTNHERERFDDQVSWVPFADGPCDEPGCDSDWTHCESAVVTLPGGNIEIERVYLCDKHATGAVVS